MRVYSKSYQGSHVADRGRSDHRRAKGSVFPKNSRKALPGKETVAGVNPNRGTVHPHALSRLAKRKKNVALGEEGEREACNLAQKGTLSPLGKLSKDRDESVRRKKERGRRRKS